MYKKMTMTKLVKEISNKMGYSYDDITLEVSAYKGDNSSESIEIEVDMYVNRYDGCVSDMYTIEVASVPIEEVDDKVEKKMLRDVKSIGEKLIKYYDDLGTENLRVRYYNDHIVEV